MKTIQIIKKLITAYFYLLLFGIIVTPIFILTREYYSLTIFDEVVIFDNNLSLNEIIVLLILLFKLSIHLYLVIIIKRSVDILSKGMYFNKKVIDYFYSAGKLFLFIALFEVAGKLLVQMILNSKLYINLNASAGLFIILGLFLMFLSEVFSRGKQLQQENDLTI